MQEAELWRQAREVFERLAELKPDVRAGALDALSDSQPEVARLVTELFEGHETSGVVDALDDAGALGLVASLHGRVGGLATPPIAPGQSVGDFEILDKLGEGGMASVYRARRRVDDFHQEVALKILEPHRLTEQGLARFRLERQLAASLDHPNIAGLIDGGVTDDGRPFFALELVDGEPIDRFCAVRQLDLEARLRLMIDVARAVHHAHGRLVVHRDLKPSNVLVAASGDGSGEVKLVDFGIAKVLSSEGSDDDPTRTLERVMTPQYASPEQFLGKPVSVASDVYQLGLILYELLAGALPYSLKTLSPAEQQRAICEDPPSRPSTKAKQTGAPMQARSFEPAAWSQSLGGDLDNIVLKALRKEPEQRYDSAARLAEDLERYLAGRPVLASRQTWTYVARKFITRHRGAVGLATVALSLVLAIGAFAVSRVLEERDRAERALGESRAVTDFLTEIFTASNPYEKPGQEETASQLLERGLERALELEREPRLKAQILAVIGEVYAERRADEKAFETLAHALQLKRRVFGPEHLEVAQVMGKLGAVERRLQRLDDAERTLRESLRQHRLLSETPTFELAEALNNLGVVRSNQGYRLLRAEQEADPAFEEAAAFLTEAVEVLQAVAPESRHAASVLANIGSIYNKARNPLAAIEYQERALEEHLRLGRLHPSTANTLQNLAINYWSVDRNEEALGKIEQANEIQRELFGELHPSTLAGLNLKGQALSKLGRHEEAVAVQREAVTGHERLHGPEARLTCFAYSALAARLLEAGQSEAAVAPARQGLELRLRSVDAADGRLYYHRSVLSRALAAAGQPREALASYRLTLVAAPQEHRPGIRDTIADLEATLGAASGARTPDTPVARGNSDGDLAERRPPPEDP